MRSHWVSVGGAVALAAVAILATMFAGFLLIGGAPPRSKVSEPVRSPAVEKTPAE